jgi:zinc protease
MVDIGVDFAAGSAYDPPARLGTAALTHALLNAGAGEWSEDALVEAFADVGAIPGASIDRDRASIQLRTLSSEPERRKAVAALAAMLQRPAFPAAALERERARLAARLREAEIQPTTLAERRFQAALYGSHPYGRVATAATVASVTRADIERFHRAHYTADRAVVTILGDLSPAAARAIAEQLTAELPPRGEGGDLPPVEPAARARRIDVPHPAQQAHVLVGMPALARTDPDYFPLLVGNYVLGGGGFVSRLTRDIRDTNGYAYSVYSYFLPLAQRGPFQIGLQTRRDQADAAIERVRALVAAFLAEGPSEAELADAKASLVGGFPLRIDSNRKLLNEWSMVGFYRLPERWLADFPARVERVTLADVRAAFARHVHPERFVTVVVGGTE